MTVSTGATHFESPSHKLKPSGVAAFGSDVNDDGRTEHKSSNLQNEENARVHWRKSMREPVLTLRFHSCFRRIR